VASLRGSANDYRSLNHDPLWLRSEIKSVRSAVKPNSAETCPVEAQRDGALTSYLIVGAGALNATHIEQRHIRHKTMNRQTIPPRLTNTAPRKCGDLDGKCLVSANGVWDDYCCGIASRNQSCRHGIGSLRVQGRSAPAGQDSQNTETCSVRCRTASCGGGGHRFERADQFTRSPATLRTDRRNPQSPHFEQSASLPKVVTRLSNPPRPRGARQPAA